MPVNRWPVRSSASTVFTCSTEQRIHSSSVFSNFFLASAARTWSALALNAKGQVEGTCVGTTFASDQVYYYNRPASVDALHGYGPTLLAGAEMIRLLQNPAIDVQHKLRTYHYVPKKP